MSGLRSTIPGYFINKKRVQECSDPLVNLRQYPQLFIATDLKGRSVLLRKMVAEKLQQAAVSLPKGIHIKILSAYRSLTEQQKLYKTYYRELEEKYPQLDKKNLENMTKAVYANPKSGGGGHQTGGAVDLTLCDDQGNDLDMGTGYLEMNLNTPTMAKNISNSAHENRMILKEAMCTVGMQNYPNEWWHFCYGDKMWATYQHKKRAIYDVIKDMSVLG